MKRPSAPSVNVSKELANLQHGVKQNKSLPKLSANTTIQRRPINHAPIASPFAGPKVRKVVYVSRKTPVMSAVKRVKKFLREIEKRALQSEGVDGVLDRRNGEQEMHKKLDEVSEKLRKDAEEVLVKASGRAMEQALRVGEWFRTREEEMVCDVVVRTGSVSVVDDIVERESREDEEDSVEVGDDNGGRGMDDEGEKQGEITLEVGDTTMELLQNLEEEQPNEPSTDRKQVDVPRQQCKGEKGHESLEGSSNLNKRKRKRKRKEYDPDDVPEARIRWVKAVEVAISLRT
ncbi:hypothetical protein H2198_003422 [Neophaeococcomyces mojaviensis]|uniref:Uncharacterized protein n=1 Tax=Neophaeococcomyces mojaviensis TaxID=3383035 RepID=A0ACC3ABJ2_9EURO|nr:hypothetical protein H2198_003422 [Knufia sp. JES_112]